MEQSIARLIMGLPLCQTVPEDKRLVHVRLEYDVLIPKAMKLHLAHDGSATGWVGTDGKIIRPIFAVEVEVDGSEIDGYVDYSHEDDIDKHTGIEMAGYTETEIFDEDAEFVG